MEPRIYLVVATVPQSLVFLLGTNRNRQDLHREQTEKEREWAGVSVSGSDAGLELH